MGQNTVFPPSNATADFLALCSRWHPQGVGQNHSGAIWDVYYALPHMAKSIAEIANGWAALVHNIEVTLQGGMEPGLKVAMGKVYSPLTHAAVAAQGLEAAFVQAYDEDIRRRETVGGATRNTQ